MKIDKTLKYDMIRLGYFELTNQSITINYSKTASGKSTRKFIMKKIQFLTGLLSVFALLILTGCQSPGISGGRGNHQTTKWQFALVDNINAAVYVGGAPVRGGGCPPGVGGMPPRQPPYYGRPMPYPGRPSCGGSSNGLMRDGQWIPQYAVNGYRGPAPYPGRPYPSYPPYGGRPPGSSWGNNGNGGGQPRRIIVNNENINNNNNSVRYIRD